MTIQAFSVHSQTISIGETERKREKEKNLRPRMFHDLAPYHSHTSVSSTETRILRGMIVRIITFRSLKTKRSRKQCRCQRRRSLYSLFLQMLNKKV